MHRQCEQGMTLAFYSTWKCKETDILYQNNRAMYKYTCTKWLVSVCKIKGTLYFKFETTGFLSIGRVNLNHVNFITRFIDFIRVRLEIKVKSFFHSAL